MWRTCKQRKWCGFERGRDIFWLPKSFEGAEKLPQLSATFPKNLRTEFRKDGFAKLCFAWTFESEHCLLLYELALKFVRGSKRFFIYKAVNQEGVKVETSGQLNKYVSSSYTCECRLDRNFAFEKQSSILLRNTRFPKHIIEKTVIIVKRDIPCSIFF